MEMWSDGEDEGGHGGAARTRPLAEPPPGQQGLLGVAGIYIIPVETMREAVSGVREGTFW